MHPFIVPEHARPMNKICPSQGTKWIAYINQDTNIPYKAILSPSKRLSTIRWYIRIT